MDREIATTLWQFPRERSTTAGARPASSSAPSSLGCSGGSHEA
jgi:hypothetical protein